MLYEIIYVQISFFFDYWHGIYKNGFKNAIQDKMCLNSLFSSIIHLVKCDSWSSNLKKMVLKMLSEMCLNHVFLLLLALFSLAISQEIKKNGFKNSSFSSIIGVVQCDSWPGNIQKLFQKCYTERVVYKSCFPSIIGIDQFHSWSENLEKWF